MTKPLERHNEPHQLAFLWFFRSCEDLRDFNEGLLPIVRNKATVEFTSVISDIDFDDKKHVLLSKIAVA